MKPIKFKEANVKLVLTGCEDLPAFADGVQVISCWKMSLKERIRALFSGVVWMGIRHESTQPPAWLKVMKTAFKKERGWSSKFFWMLGTLRRRREDKLDARQKASS